MANVFVVAGGGIRTPPVEDGARPGVLREWVVSRTEAVPERVLRDATGNAEEIFLTNSWMGVMPVARFGERTLPSTGVARRLLAEYREELNRQQRA
jgi:branched-subunit amino acid aminotransferase/4-amino-4-deoxychorismate lyase